MHATGRPRIDAIVAHRFAAQRIRRRTRAHERAGFPFDLGFKRQGHRDAVAAERPGFGARDLADQMLIAGRGRLAEVKPRLPLAAGAFGKLGPNKMRGGRPMPHEANNTAKHAIRNNMMKAPLCLLVFENRLSNARRKLPAIANRTPKTEPSWNCRRIAETVNPPAARWLAGLAPCDLRSARAIRGEKIGERAQSGRTAQSDACGKPIARSLAARPGREL